MKQNAMDRRQFLTTTAGIALGGFGGWAEANDYIVANSSEAMESLQKAHYSQTPLADIYESFKAQKMLTSRDWKRLYSNGTVTNWLQQSTDFFMTNAGLYDDINKNARRMPDISGRGNDQRSLPFALTFRPFAELPEQSLLLGG